MKYFVREESIVREIWGKSDTILFIFGGAAAEFALNKAVDWLYYTGKLPADPLGRLFSTVSYARQIVFSEREAANRAIDKIVTIHAAVENNRGSTIPDWAYRDVLFMLIHYSISSYELLERKLTKAEKEEVFEVFYRVGDRMGIPGLPVSYGEWLIVREQHMQDDLLKSKMTKDLFKQYRKHLGACRYRLLIEGQKLVVPKKVSKLLGFGGVNFLVPVLALYKLGRFLKLDKIIKAAILPKQYQQEIRGLDVA